MLSFPYMIYCFYQFCPFIQHFIFSTSTFHVYGISSIHIKHTHTLTQTMVFLSCPQIQENETLASLRDSASDPCLIRDEMLHWSPGTQSRVMCHRWKVVNACEEFSLLHGEYQFLVLSYSMCHGRKVSPKLQLRNIPPEQCSVQGQRTEQSKTFGLQFWC